MGKMRYESHLTVKLKEAKLTRSVKILGLGKMSPHVRINIDGINKFISKAAKDADRAPNFLGE